MLLLYDVTFSVINNLGTLSSEQQVNFSVLQIGAEISATGGKQINMNNYLKNFIEG